MNDIFFMRVYCRLHMVFSSQRHLMVAGGCVIVMEILYKMDFSLPGFLICAAILGFGMNASFFFDSFLFVMKVHMMCWY